MSVAPENLQTIKNAYALFFAGDLDGFFSMFDENVEMIEAETLPYGGVFRGRENVRNAVVTVTKLWDNINLDIHVLTAGDDYVIAYGQFSAVARSTGRKATFPLAEVWRLRNGKVVFLNPVYGDTAVACAALGQQSK